MKNHLRLLLAFSLMFPLCGFALVYAEDVEQPAVQGVVREGQGPGVFNAVCIMTSADPGKTFKYYMVTDFVGWILIDIYDSLEVGYRGGFILKAFEDGAGSAVAYGIPAGSNLYGKASLMLKNKSASGEVADVPFDSKPPGFYLAFWKNRILDRYDIVVYNPSVLLDAPREAIAVTDGKGELGAVKKCKKSFFFWYRPAGNEDHLAFQASGHEERGGKYEKTFRINFDTEYFNTGFVSYSGGTVCIGKDDRTRIIIPEGAYPGRGKVIPVTISRSPGENIQHEVVYEFSPNLTFIKPVSLVMQIPGEDTQPDTSSLWKVSCYDEEKKGWTDCEAEINSEEGTLSVRTRGTGRFRLFFRRKD